jgi:hypothetical protein
MFVRFFFNGPSCQDHGFPKAVILNLKREKVLLVVPSFDAMGSTWSLKQYGVPLY